MKDKVWEIVNKSKKDVVQILFENRGLTTKRQQEEFFNPTSPYQITLKEIGISEVEMGKVIERLKIARKLKEKVIVFGDYDADGVCATTIMWEALYERGIDALPYIPDRFSEGYGLKSQAIKELAEKYTSLKVIITVDNGIVAYEGIKTAKDLGIDVIVTDHHQKGSDKLVSYATIHSTKTSGSALSWFVAREISKSIRKTRSSKEIDINLDEGLALASIGTISDQLPLVGINRSVVKMGLGALRKTRKPGLMALARGANIKSEDIGVYEVGFVVAPRINAAGRLSHAIDSLRLMCTKDNAKAEILSNQISQANEKRQKMVEKMFLIAQGLVKKETASFIVVASPEFHEGVIGLIASRLVEKYNRPAIVFASGPEVSKASARSISGVDIISAIRKLDAFLLEAGGHEMAAGFSVLTKNITTFEKQLNKIGKALVTPDLLVKKLKIDAEVDLQLLSWDLAKKISEFEPFGVGNLSPVLVSCGLKVEKAKPVGSDGKHLKMTVKSDDNIRFDAIAFGFGELYPEILEKTINLAYNLETNTYNGSETLQLKVRDIQYGDPIQPTGKRP